MTLPVRLGLFYGAIFIGTGVSSPYLPVWFADHGLSGAQIGLILSLPMLARAFTADPKAADAPWSSIIVDEIAPNAIPEPSYPWDVSLAVGTALESVMKGSASPDAAIATAEKAIQTVIDRDGLADKAPKN